MKLHLFLLLIIVACNSLNMKEEFFSWMKQNGKSYSTMKEREYRSTVFEANWNKIQKWNTEKTHGTATFAINEYSDLTPEEFQSTYANCVKSTREKLQGPVVSKRSLAGIPASIDWRKAGAVTHVKNQGQCGSCWSFATTGTVEGAHFIATKKLVSLSEQDLVDCSQNENNDGCDGGRVD